MLNEQYLERPAKVLNLVLSRIEKYIKENRRIIIESY